MNPLNLIETLEDLSNSLSLSVEELEYILNYKEQLISSLIIPKNSGGIRKVYQIHSDSYNKVIRYIREKLCLLYTPHDCVHGFVKKKNTLTNASHHLDKRVIINLDIKNFFDSISEKQIIHGLSQIGLSRKTIDIILSFILLKDIDGTSFLPTGFSTSPIISNIVCIKLDKDFLNFSKKVSYYFTRYGDDISLSTNTKYIPKKEDFEIMLQKYGFSINHKKYKIQKRGGNRYVTGLTTCEKNKAHLPRITKKRLRQEIYFIKKYGLWEHIKHMDSLEKSSLFHYGEKSIRGWASFLILIDRNLSTSLIDLLEKGNFEIPREEIELLIKEITINKKKIWT